MTYWPKWLKVTFLVSACVFLLAGLATRSEVVSRPNPSWSWSFQNNGDSANIPGIITAVAGLVTAVSGLYGQILTGRKMKLDHELAMRQLELQSQTPPPKPKADG